MEYEEFIDRIKELDFIPNEDTADAGIKAVLGILASSMSETRAKDLLGRLPHPLNLEKLRGHQKTPTPVSVDVYISEIAEQFSLTHDQARTLINQVMTILEEATGINTRTLFEA